MLTFVLSLRSEVGSTTNVYRRLQDTWCRLDKRCTAINITLFIDVRSIASYTNSFFFCIRTDSLILLIFLFLHQRVKTMSVVSNFSLAAKICFSRRIQCEKSQRSSRVASFYSYMRLFFH